MQQQQQSPSSLPTTDRADAITRFCQTYNPSYQQVICDSQDKCFFGDYPTLATVRRNLGSNAAVAWLVPQITNLAVYCGCRDKLSKEQYKDCAFVIATEYFYLKISELMLFFHRFKAGHYGRFYGSVDPLVITTSLREFITERAMAYERHEQKQREAREKESLRRNPPMTRAEYDEIRQLELMYEMPTRWNNYLRDE